VRAHQAGVARVRVDAGADGGGAHVDLVQVHTHLAQPVDVLADGDAVRVELLAERHGHRVLQLRAAHLHDVGELLALEQERVAQ
jgi:hypothetical protein